MTGPALALDIGGTKMLAALVEGERVLDTHRMPTPANGMPGDWLAALFSEIAAWRGRYGSVGVAVTGIVDDGLWSALNARTLNIPERFALVETVANLAGSPVLAANDAQAAAWGEYRFGASRGTDMVFLTISTGIGGGIVVNGRLLGGMAGNFGQFVGDDAQGPLEDRVSGKWIAAEARRHQPGATAREVFAAADEGLGWANAILDISAGRVARLARNIQFALDPARIVIGGGIGLVPSYLDRVRQALTEMPARLRPDIHAAALGGNAGIIGIADLARHNPTGGERT